MTDPQSLENILQDSLKELADIKFALDVSSIVAITDHKGIITYVNDNFCRISKYNREELLGQDHRIINSGYHNEGFFKNLWRTIAQGRVWKGEIKNKTKDGHYYWVDTTIIPFVDKKGKPRQYISIRNEITQRKYMEQEIKLLTQNIIKAQEKERERIARDIHDDLGQSLVTLKMLLQSSLCDQEDHALKDNHGHKKIFRCIDQTIEKARKLATTLRPATLEVLGLTTALKSLVNEFRNDKLLNIKTRIINVDRFVFKAEAINFFRIIQESLTNIVKHAHATTVYLKINKSKDQLIISIEDDGLGFDEDKLMSHRSDFGLGLSTMQERAKLLGGNCDIHSEKGQGTTVKIYIPIIEEKNG